MTTFVLLHGSWHAAWNWHRLVPLLHELGYGSVAIDMPGHGRDRTPARKVSLGACVDRVLEVVDAIHGDVVLVAHSRNGIVISQAAERRPERIRGLVYLAAYLVPDGRSMMDYAVLDPDSLVVRNIEPPVGRRLVDLLRVFARSAAMRWLLTRVLPRRLQTHSLRRSAFREALYHDCPGDITELANALLEPEPTLAGFTPLRLTAERWGRVPRVYVECTQDRAVTLPLQRRMQRESPCAHVFSLDTGHSPFFSRPRALAELLVESVRVFDAARPGYDRRAA